MLLSEKVIQKALYPCNMKSIGLIQKKIQGLLIIDIQEKLMPVK